MADAEVSQPFSFTTSSSETDKVQRASNGSNESISSSDSDIPVENATPDVAELEIAEKLPATDGADSNVPAKPPTPESIKPNIPETLSMPAPTSQNVSAPQRSPATNSNPTIPSTLQSTTLPKARLPHDTTGILEDRIKEDPRGDLDAWLALIKEHRNRNKLDDARAVYERFFKVFPQAVSVAISIDFESANGV
jgi:cleavage stimulation factor subunit 3